MNISFYKKMEFENIHHYNLEKAQEKGTYYVKILNQIEEIIKWLDEFLLITKNNKEPRLIFPNSKKYEIDFNLYKMIRSSFSIKFYNELNNLEKYKNTYKEIEKTKNRIENKTVNTKLNIEKFKSMSNSLKNIIERSEIDIEDKSLLLIKIKNNIDFLKWHKRKVDYMLIKENPFKNDISKNQIDLFFSTKIVLPPYTKELCFKEENTLKRATSIYSKYSDKNEKEKNTQIRNCIKNTKFEYIDKYLISSISELMNLYFDEILKNNIILKKCKNCGKYFIAHNKQLYCDNPSPQNKNISCRKLSDDLREKENKIYEAYRKTYKTQHNKLKRNIDVGNIPEIKLKERFKKWNNKAISKKDTCKTVDEYTEWYKTSTNWIEDYR